MIRSPTAAEPLVQAVQTAGVFTKPTFERFILLMSGLIVTMGRRTVSRALRVMEPSLPQGHWCNYHRLWSQARFSMWKLAAVLVRRVIVTLLPAVDQPIVLLVDDTLDRKDGDRVWAKGAHRDAARSSHSRDNIAFGHQWLAMCVLAWLPGMSRPWALPVLCGLCLSPKVAQKIGGGRRPKTASRIARQLLIRMMRWFPDRKFILIGDYKVVTHETAAFAHRHRDRVTVVGRLRGDANLYDPPRNPRRRARGGGRAQKGRKQPAPCRRVGPMRPSEQELAWYGSSRRTVKLVSDTGLWYGKHDNRVIAIRWVCVLGDAEQGRENAYFYTTDLSMEPARIVELYAARWNIEVTFQECRALLGLGTTRHWCRRSVLRVTPVLLGLFTGVALIWKELSASSLGHAKPPELLSQTPCYRKRAMTFADALYLVRRQVWEQSLLRCRVGHRRRGRCLNSLPRPLRTMLLWHLAAAA